MNLAQREQLDRFFRDLNDIWNVILKDFFIVFWFWVVVWLISYFFL